MAGRVIEPYGARMTRIAAETIRRCKEEGVAVADVIGETAAIYANNKFADGFLEAKHVYEGREDGSSD